MVQPVKGSYGISTHGLVMSHWQRDFLMCIGKASHTIPSDGFSVSYDGTFSEMVYFAIAILYDVFKSVTVASVTSGQANGHSGGASVTDSGGSLWSMSLLPQPSLRPSYPLYLFSARRKAVVMVVVAAVVVDSVEANVKCITVVQRHYYYLMCRRNVSRTKDHACKEGTKNNIFLEGIHRVRCRDELGWRLTRSLTLEWYMQPWHTKPSPEKKIRPKPSKASIAAGFVIQTLGASLDGAFWLRSGSSRQPWCLKHRVVQYIRSGDMTKNLRVTIALASVTLIWFLNEMLPRRDRRYMPTKPKHVEQGTYW
ncbi:hypothetical protein EDD22DRAFT_1025387 [Suillus occidentalis]|nr:hypothetical protein EDD22DRAFT_1025387 [Suillus occidentalis]